MILMHLVLFSKMKRLPKLKAEKLKLNKVKNTAPILKFVKFYWAYNFWKNVFN